MSVLSQISLWNAVAVMYVSIIAARSISIIAHTSSLTSFFSTFLKCWSFSFSCIIALDSDAPAIAVMMYPALSGIRCVSDISASVAEFVNCASSCSRNAAKNDALYAIRNIAPAP